MSRHQDVFAVLGFATVYVLIGAVSLSTAYVQTNAAAVWLPAGYAAGLLIIRGSRMWPAVALGAFLLNLGDNLAVTRLSPIAAIAVAATIALGNTAEAIFACKVADRRAGGADLLGQPKYLAGFAMWVAPLSPVISAVLGVAASRAAGLPALGNTVEVGLTWYLADSLGILVVTPSIVALATLSWPKLSRYRLAEFAALVAALVFVGQTMSGRYLMPSMQDWPRPYMAMPLLLWAAFRFSTFGAQLAIILVASGSIIGTALGHAVFPSPSPSRSLLSLQLFLGLLSITTLTIAAALARLAELQDSLERDVTDRTIKIKRLQREQKLMTTLVVHDLKSPLYGVRNALRALADALREDRIDSPSAIAALVVVDETCSSMAERITNLLASEKAKPPVRQSEGELISTVIEHVVSSIGPAARKVRLQGEPALLVRQSLQVERILNGLISNAIRHGPPNHPISVTAFEHQQKIEIHVSDAGTGISIEEQANLFKLQECARAKEKSECGLGLYFASEMAETLGGRLTLLKSAPTTTFRLVFPI